LLNSDVKKMEVTNMTKNLNKYYDVTVTHAKKVGPRRWLAKAQVFRKDNPKMPVETFYTEGGTMTSADSKALDEATRKYAYCGKPEDWKDSV